MIDRLNWAAESSDTTSNRIFTCYLAGNMLTDSAVGTPSYPSQGYGIVRPHAPLCVGGVALSYNGDLTVEGGRTLCGACPPT